MPPRGRGANASAGPSGQKSARADTTWEMLSEQKNITSYIEALPDWCFVSNAEMAKRTKKVLVLDLDGILLYSTIKPQRRYDFIVEYYVDGRICTHFVTLRPHLKRFLDIAGSWYRLYLYTTSEEQYASIIADRLEFSGKIFGKRLYRKDCDYVKGSYIKDFKHITLDLSQVIILDVGFVPYGNKLPISPYEGDKADNELLTALTFLDGLRYCDDVRSVLSLTHL